VLLKDGTVTADGRTIAVPVDAPALADVYADIGGRVA
jgi:hypothetical protein